VHGPSPYGPLWTWIEVLAASLTGSVAGALLLLKALVVAASLGCAVVIWKILGRVRPEDRLLGTLVYLWNPLIVVEFAGEGHNDAVMILFVLVSLLFTVTARPALSAMGAVVGVLVKYLPVMFSPAQAIYLWRTRRSTPRLALSVALALVYGLILTAALYWPFWIGADTFGALRQQGLPFLAPTPSGILYWLLLHAAPPEQAAALTLRILGVLFLLFVLVAGWRARDAAGLLRACAAISLVYLLVVSAGTWPWYAALPLALAALTPRGVFLPMALVVTFTSRLVAPFSNLVNNRFAGWNDLIDVATVVSVTLPLAVLLPLCVLTGGGPQANRAARKGIGRTLRARPTRLRAVRRLGTAAGPAPTGTARLCLADPSSRRPGARGRDLPRAPRRSGPSLPPCGWTPRWSPSSKAMSGRAMTTSRICRNIKSARRRRPSPCGPAPRPSPSSGSCSRCPRPRGRTSRS
jgi:hypothetical protein